MSDVYEVPQKPFSRAKAFLIGVSIGAGILLIITIIEFLFPKYPHSDSLPLDTLFVDSIVERPIVHTIILLTFLAGVIFIKNRFWRMVAIGAIATIIPIYIFMLLGLALAIVTWLF